MAGKARYSRVLLKLSGEALQGGQSFGIDNKVVERIVGEVAEVVRLGVKLGIVVGGGNFVRGADVSRAGGDRVSGDRMGILGTVMNAIALEAAFAKAAVEA